MDYQRLSRSFQPFLDWVSIVSRPFCWKISVEKGPVRDLAANQPFTNLPETLCVFGKGYFFLWSITISQFLSSLEAKLKFEAIVRKHLWSLSFETCLRISVEIISSFVERRWMLIIQMDEKRRWSSLSL